MMCQGSPVEGWRQMLYLLIICKLFNDALSTADNVTFCIEWDLNIKVNGKRVKIWKKVAVACLNVLNWHLAEGTQEDHDKYLSG
jgi:hypothetical protein